jgi:hypothetical protein
VAQTIRWLRILIACTSVALSASAGATGEEMAGEAAPVEPSAPAGQGASASPGTTAAAASATDAVTTAANGHVALARFTTAIENREPVDAVSFLENDARLIYFYTDLRDLSGQTVTHRWQLGSEVMAEVPFEVGSPRWRVWSSKRLQPEWTGDWKVDVVDSDGKVIASETFTYQRKPSP